MHPTILAGQTGTITAHPDGYVAVHPHGHSSHGPLPTKAAAVITAHLTQLPDIITATRDDTTGWADDFYTED